MPASKRKRNTKAAKKSKAKTKKTPEKPTTTRPEEDVPSINDTMKLNANNSSSNEYSSGFGDIRINTVFITLKVQLSTRTTLLEELRQKYIAFSTTIMEADESIMVETADPDKKGDPIKARDDFPVKMTGIRNYFYSSG